VDEFVSECLFTMLSSHIVIVILHLQYDKFVFVDGSAVSLTTNAQNYDTTILPVGGSQQGKATMCRVTVAVSDVVICPVASLRIGCALLSYW